MIRREESLPQAFQAPVDVHASADGQVYMFRGRQDDSAASSSEDDFNVMELRPQKRREWDRIPAGKVQLAERERVGDLQLLERNISQGDNLNKLALQYGCNVADIKRANNLMQEQDLYALTSIKIPVKKHGLLLEANVGPTEAPSSAPEPKDPFGRLHTHQYTAFLREVDRDIERLIQTADARSEGTDRPHRRGPGGSSGADWGIQWWNAVVAMLLIGIILPVFYLVYFKTQDAGGSAGDHDGPANANLMISSNGSGGPLGGLPRALHA